MDILKTTVNPYGFEDVLQAIQGKGFIAGGAARHIAYLNEVLRPEPPYPRDIDIFRYTKDDKYPYIGHKLAEAGWRGGSRTLHSYEYRQLNRLKVQVINPHANSYIKMWGSIAEVLSQFDYTINLFAVEYVGGQYILHYTEQAIEDNVNKKLHVQHCNSPVAMATRASKYAAKGYKMSPAEWLGIFQGWDDFDPLYKERVATLLEDNDDIEALNYILMG